jgi:hypothetical protein
MKNIMYNIVSEKLRHNSTHSGISFEDTVVNLNFKITKEEIIKEFMKEIEKSWGLSYENYNNDFPSGPHLCIKDPGVTMLFEDGMKLLSYLVNFHKCGIYKEIIEFKKEEFNNQDLIDDIYTLFKIKIHWL